MSGLAQVYTAARNSLRLILVAAISMAGPMLASGASAAPGSNDTLYQQRAAYKTALDHLTAGRSKSYSRAKAKLHGYVLAPYLDYYELQSRLSVATAKDIAEFRDSHGYLPVADIVRYRWLKRLGRRRQWQTFLDHWEPSGDAELLCYRSRALYGTGQREDALAQVPALWLVSHSQPKACDPLFESWIKGGHLTEDVAWQRLQLAISANARTLARYLQRFFTGAAKPWAQSYYNVHVNPSAISRTGRYLSDTVRSREVIVHGLSRLAMRDPAAATTAWNSYRLSHSFTPAGIQRVQVALAVGDARAGKFSEDPSATPDSAALDMAQAAISVENWVQAAHWIERLEPSASSERRWQYWLARSLDGSGLDAERAGSAYQTLARERDYYGFLAAEQIGYPISLNHRPLVVKPLEINKLRRKLNVQRSIELFAIGDLVNARREWRALLPTLNPQEKAAAASLAGTIGWTAQSIHTASDEALRDTLELRFPLAFPNSFQQVSFTTTVNQSFLLAIGRQESAFDPRARSPVNARGVMQMMSSTAGTVAKRIGISAPSASELYDPNLNIELAGHHIAALLDRYEHQRPLAAAAYNAGVSRVNRWTRDQSGRSMDVWIETIPFSETRSYVKSVLAFDQVYGQLLNSPVPMLQVHEAAVR